MAVFTTERKLDVGSRRCVSMRLVFAFGHVPLCVVEGSVLESGNTG